MFLENNTKNKISRKYINLDFDKFPIINKYKYLGIWIDNNFNLDENTKIVIGKM